jgi:hypothetical protein
MQFQWRVLVGLRWVERAAEAIEPLVFSRPVA